jgi:hypothetical protein
MTVRPGMNSQGPYVYQNGLVVVVVVVVVVLAIVRRLADKAEREWIYKYLPLPKNDML